jgi:hypothetical protein
MQIEEGCLPIDDVSSPFEVVNLSIRAGNSPYQGLQFIRISIFLFFFYHKKKRNKRKITTSYKILVFCASFYRATQAVPKPINCKHH